MRRSGARAISRRTRSCPFRGAAQSLAGLDCQTEGAWRSKEDVRKLRKLSAAEKRERFEQLRHPTTRPV